jgi:hypothetical protein
VKYVEDAEIDGLVVVNREAYTLYIYIYICTPGNQYWCMAINSGRETPARNIRVQTMCTPFYLRLFYFILFYFSLFFIAFIFPFSF